MPDCTYFLIMESSLCWAFHLSLACVYVPKGHSKEVGGMGQSMSMGYFALK